MGDYYYGPQTVSDIIGTAISESVDGIRDSTEISTLQDRMDPLREDEEEETRSEFPPSPTMETEIRHGSEAWDLMECAICHETASRDPVSMGCNAQHVYCFGCVFQYFKSMNGAPVSCPQCRGGDGTFVVMSRLKKLMDACHPPGGNGDQRLYDGEFTDIPTSGDYFVSAQYLREMFPQRFSGAEETCIVTPMQMRYFVQNFNTLRRLLAAQTTIEDPSLVWRSYNGNLLPFNLVMQLGSNSSRSSNSNVPEPRRWPLPRVARTNGTVVFDITDDEIEGEGFRIDFSPRPSPNRNDEREEEEGSDDDDDDDDNDNDENTAPDHLRNMVNTLMERMRSMNSQLSRMNALAAGDDENEETDGEIDRLAAEAIREIRSMREEVERGRPPTTQTSPIREPLREIRQTRRPASRSSYALPPPRPGSLLHSIFSSPPQSRHIQDFNASDIMRSWVANRYNVCHVAITFPFVTVGRRRSPHFRVSLSRSSAISHLVSHASALYFGVVIAMALSRTPPSRDDFTRYIPVCYFSRVGAGEVRQVDQHTDLLTFLRRHDEEIGDDPLMVTVWSILAEIEEAFRQGVLSHMVSREYGLVENGPIEAMA